MNPLFPHYKATLRLGLPIAVGQLGFIIMGFADTLMVGRYATTSLAAAAFVNTLFNLVTFVIIGYSYGLSPLISAHCGRGELRAAGSTLRQAMVANGLFGALLTAVMAVLFFFLDYMGQPAEIMPEVRSYYLVMLSSLIFLAAANMLRQFTDGTSDTATGMWVLLAGNVVNVVLNALLIYGIGPFPRLGLLGAGLATLLSRLFTVAAMVAVLSLRRRYRPFMVGWLASRIHWGAVRRVNAQSLPVALQMAMETGAFTFSGVMAGWFGAAQLAGYQVVMTIGSLGFLLYSSFGSGIGIRVARYSGTADRTGVHLAATAGCHILCAMAATASLVFWLFGSTLADAFTTDSAVRSAAIALIPMLILYQFADAMQVCFAHALRGTGYVRPMVRVAFFSYLLLNIPCALLFGLVFGWGVQGIFLALTLGLSTAAPLYYRHFRRARQGGEL